MPADRSTVADREQHFAVRLHNPLCAETLTVSATLQADDGLSATPSPTETTLPPGDIAVLDLTVNAPADGRRRELTAVLTLRAGEQSCERRLPVPVRPVIELPVAAEAADDLFQDDHAPVLHALAGDREHGRLALARRDECLLVAAELFDDRCTATAAPTDAPPQLELFVDALGGYEPMQAIVRAAGYETHARVLFNRFGEAVDAPAVDAAVHLTDGIVRLTAAIPLAAFGLAPDADGFLVEAALVTARAAERPAFVSLCGSPRPFLDSRGYAKAVCARDPRGLS